MKSNNYKTIKQESDNNLSMSKVTRHEKLFILKPEPGHLTID